MIRFRFLFALFLAPCLWAETRLATPFTDHAVLQRDTTVPVWGWDEPGTRIKVKGSWGESASAKTGPDGRWMAKLDTGRAGGPYTMTVTGSSTLTLTNVLLGEVWLCSGQSNMEWTLGRHQVKNGPAEVAAASYPNIRLMLVPKVSAKAPGAMVPAAWKVCAPETVADFSAVAYFFGRMLHSELKVPVGLIASSWGGTEIEAWISREGIASEPSLAAHLDPAVAAACEARMKAVNRADPGHRPGWLYNGMIAPLQPFAIRGAIWYQGESNAGRAAQYRTSFPLLIKDWRRAWGRGDFPFYFVQLAPFSGYRSWNPPGSSAELREAQLMTHRLVPRSGMVVTTDITDDVNNIHPLNKQDVGVRLAGWALAETYRRHWPFSGPLYRDCKIEGDHIRIRFYHPGEMTSRGEPLREFQIAGADRKFVDAVAEVDGRTVVVRSKDVPEPKAVRYGWSDTPSPNLRNSTGLPASPFRTDDWPGITDQAVW